MTKAPRVTIDGVEYVPATSIRGMGEVIQALALQYHTPDTLREYGTESLWVTVHEDPDMGGETLQEFAARLATVVADE